MPVFKIKEGAYRRLYTFSQQLDQHHSLFVNILYVSIIKLTTLYTFHCIILTAYQKKIHGAQLQFWYFKIFKYKPYLKH